MNKKADAIIIGAGVIGSSVAFELAKRGYKTLNIDKCETCFFPFWPKTKFQQMRIVHHPSIIQQSSIHHPCIIFPDWILV